jgi:hypothetical protein
MICVGERQVGWGCPADPTEADFRSVPFTALSGDSVGSVERGPSDDGDEKR